MLVKNRYMIKIKAKITAVTNIEQGWRGKPLGVTTFLTEIVYVIGLGIFEAIRLNL